MKVSPTLRDFQRSDAENRCIVGPFGSGKSSACVIEFLRRAAKQAPGPDGVRHTRFAAIRNTYGQLRDTTRKTFEEWVPANLGTWQEQAFTWRGKWSDGKHLIDTEILFRALDRPEDVKKLLSLELTGAWVNEAREIPKAVFDALQGRVTRYPSKANGGATWSGIWLDTNPWHTGHWGYRLFSKRENIRPEDQRRFMLFEQPGGRSVNAENLQNLEAGYYDRIAAGKDSEWVECYVDGKYPSSDVGSIWGRAIAAVDARHGISEFRHPSDGMYTSWDLGVSDSTAIWWWRIGPDRQVDVIDHYEASGEAASHYFGEVERRGWKVQTHFLPHDARQRSWATGVGVLDQFIKEYGAEHVEMTPEMSLRDGIQAARWLLEQPIRIHTRCAQGIDALREYRYEFDEDAQVFSTRPRHDWSSHSADAFRYLALVAKETEIVTRRVIEAPPPATRDLRSFTIDELWEMRPQRKSGRV